MAKQELISPVLATKKDEPLLPIDDSLEIPETEDWEEIVENLPDELRKHWATKLMPLVEAGEITNVDACRIVREAIAKRAKALGAYVTHDEQKSEKSIEQTSIFQRLMETQTAEHEIGSGNVAKVYEVAGAEDFCLKVVWNQDAYKEENTVSQESYFLETLSNFTVAGVRTPHYVDFFSGLQMNAILMERINGSGLDKIMAGEEEFPAKFSFEDFFRRLEEYFEALHKKNIFHMDVFPRNIMVDRETGLPVVIDFGKSKHKYFSEEVKDNWTVSDRDGLRNAKKEVHDFMIKGYRPQLLAELDKKKKI